MRTILLFTAVLALAAGCGTSKTTVDNGKVFTIVHGTSFGHCRGYCIKEEKYQPTAMAYTQFNRDSTNFPKKEQFQAFTETEFNALTATIDWTKWNQLEETIGCPDCADGGAEYIEITTAKGTKKVTFDAYSNPDGLEQLLVLLRARRKELEKNEGQ